MSLCWQQTQMSKAARGLLFGRLCFFLQHDVCGKVQNWIIADTFLTAGKLYFLFGSGSSDQNVGPVSNPLRDQDIS